MNRLYLIAPDHAFLEPEQHRAAARTLMAGFQTLWHPQLLRNAEAAPALRSPDDPPDGDDWLALVPKSFEETISKVPAWKRGRVVTIDLPETCVGEAAIELIAKKIDLPTGYGVFERDLHAFAFARMCLYVIFLHLKHDDALDTHTIWSEIKQSLEFGPDQPERRHYHIANAFDSLHGSRSNFFPASIHLLDLALWRAGVSSKAIDRLRMSVPINVIMTGKELEAAARDEPDVIEEIKKNLERDFANIISGPFNNLPWSLTPLESRCWQADRSADLVDEHFEKELECFGNRTLAMTPELPQFLMKNRFKTAIHQSFDGARLPRFRKSKMNWNAADASSVEALVKPSVNAADENGLFVTLAGLAASMDEDRSPVVPLAHLIGGEAAWFKYWIRGAEFSPVLGRFETASDYFMNSSYSDLSTQTHPDEYTSTALTDAVARVSDDPISQWIDLWSRRSEFDASATLISLARLATLGEHPVPPDFSAIETKLESVGKEAWPEVAVAAKNWRDAALQRIAQSEFSPDAQHGYIVFNTCSFPRRLGVTLPTKDAIAIESPVRAVQKTEAGSAVVVDVPGWGWSWIPTTKDAGKPPNMPSIATGRKLRNEFIEVEIDGSTGGIRGLWDVRTGYSRLGQQLVSAKGSRMVAKSRTTSANGSAFGEITTSGIILSSTGKETIAQFRQVFRLWVGRPILEIEIDLEPLVPVEGKPDEDYFACRWAFPDEKTLVLVADGLTMHTHRGSFIESPMIMELRERQLSTAILNGGLPFSNRPQPRMADTMLIAKGETRRHFRVGVAIDYARPLTAAMDFITPTFVHPVEGKPETGVRSSSLCQLGLPITVASALRPSLDDENRVLARVAEITGKSGRAEIKFKRQPDSVRLANGRGETIFELYQTEGVWPVDFSPHEMQMIEIGFGEPPRTES